MHDAVFSDQGTTQLGLFSAPKDTLSQFLEEVDPDEMTPREALKMIYRMKKGIGL